MSALVTDQFRILNTNNFISSIEDPSNAYYVFLGLSNPTAPGYGRTTGWDSSTPSPTDNFDYQNHCFDTMLFGKKVTPLNAKRVIRRIDWSLGTRYELYRHDYSVSNPSPITQSVRLYDANYYVMNENYQVYICIDNGSSGSNRTGNASRDQPLFTDLEPSRAGESGDGYIWKYLFTVSPSDILKFDSTEYICLPNNWSTSNDFQIQSIRENSNSKINQNQIKKIYIQNGGFGYSGGLGQEVDIIGDGVGAKAVIDVVDGVITNAIISSGGSGYTYGMVDLGSINQNSYSNPANLITIIPPSNGHGYDIYKELGADKVLIYARFDDSTRDYPIDTKFSQIGIVKNPTSFGSTSTFIDNQFSSLNSIKFSTTSGTLSVGDKISQSVSGGIAYGYVASIDNDANVVKYFQDRSLYLNRTTLDTTDYIGISSGSKVLDFVPTAAAVTTDFGFSGVIDSNFTGITINPTGFKNIDLGSNFTNGLSNPEINKSSGDILYIDNRPTVARNIRQKEDIKIILEF
jgi:hypothetical protein